MTANQPPNPNSNVDDLTPAFADPSVEEQIYSLIVQSDEAWSAPAVADHLECSTDTARKYLNWFTELGIVRRHDGRPATYERNEDYFEWRYVTQFADTHTLTELKENVLELRERLRAYREQYGVESPDAIDLTDDVRDLDEDIEEVWDALTSWASIEDELRLHERARRTLTGDTGAQTAE